MASGTGERPTLDYSAERNFLELGGWRVMSFEISANTNKYVKVESPSSGMRNGLLWIYSSTNTTRNGCYMYSRGSGSLILTPIKAVTQSGMSVAASGDYIAITGSTGYLYCSLIYIVGAKPEVVSTLPT